MEIAFQNLDELLASLDETEKACPGETQLHRTLCARDDLGWLIFDGSGKLLATADELAAMRRERLDALGREAIECLRESPACAFRIPTAQQSVVVLAVRLADEDLIAVRLQRASDDEELPSEPIEIYRRVCAGALQAATQLRDECRRLQTRMQHRQAELEMMESLQQEAFAGSLAEREERLRQQELKAEWERLCREAESAARAKNEFLSNVSHELRTPLTAVLGYTEMLLGETGDITDYRPQLEVIHRNGETLLRLIDDILCLSKLESGKLELRTTSIAPWEIIEEVAAMMRPRAEERGLEIRIEYSFPLPERIQTDPFRLRQILVNLVGNAIKFTEQGYIDIRARCVRAAGGHSIFQIDVADTGVGIEPRVLQQLFAPFAQRGNASQPSPQGIGLGLTVAQRMARVLGGRLEACSYPGKGSVFTVSVDPGPLDGVAMVAAIPGLDVSAATATACEKPVRPRRILLAEDGPDNQRLIRHLLTKAGYEVDLAENGCEAWRMAVDSAAKGLPYDMILMDMQMPEMDGYEATRRLRENGWDGPIVALTAHALPDDREKCLQVGCDGYLSKPIKREQLLEYVREKLAEEESSAERSVSDCPLANGDGDLASHDAPPLPPSTSLPGLSDSPSLP
ncbi:MAG: response regulator [Planctomycetota bacterium]|nr:MAG: response regulator [Planctomycetota bacterium]